MPIVIIDDWSDYIKRPSVEKEPEVEQKETVEYTGITYADCCPNVIENPRYNRDVVTVNTVVPPDVRVDVDTQDLIVKQQEEYNKYMLSMYAPEEKESLIKEAEAKRNSVLTEEHMTETVDELVVENVNEPVGETNTETVIDDVAVEIPSINDEPVENLVTKETSDSNNNERIEKIIDNIVANYKHIAKAHIVFEDGKEPDSLDIDKVEKITGEEMFDQLIAAIRKYAVDIKDVEIDMYAPQNPVTPVKKPAKPAPKKPASKTKKK